MIMYRNSSLNKSHRVNVTKHRYSERPSAESSEVATRETSNYAIFNN